MGKRWAKLCQGRGHPRQDSRHRKPFPDAIGGFQVSTTVIKGVEDLVVRKPVGHKKFITKVFSGLDGSLLSVLDTRA
jgi:hypothetical protein